VTHTAARCASIPRPDSACRDFVVSYKMVVLLGAVHNRTSRLLDLGTEMTAEQCRKARELLKWTQQVLASTANVTPWIIDAFEDGRDVLPSYVDAIRTCWRPWESASHLSFRTAALLRQV
jgi:DNA-binding XRE family transcriptional regulator